MRKSDGSRMRLIEQTLNKCKNFNGMVNGQCKAGVTYADVRVVTEGKPHRYPCWISDGCTSGCQHAVFPTQEEAEERERKVQKSMENYTTARNAIVAHTEGKRGVAGSIECPVCKTGVLRFSIAGCNGHIHAKCNSEGCVSWME